MGSHRRFCFRECAVGGLENALHVANNLSPNAGWCPTIKMSSIDKW